MNINLKQCKECHLFRECYLLKLDYAFETPIFISKPKKFKLFDYSLLQSFWEVCINSLDLLRLNFHSQSICLSESQTAFVGEEEMQQHSFHLADEIIQRFSYAQRLFHHCDRGDRELRTKFKSRIKERWSKVFLRCSFISPCPTLV